jgi:hypothetical protein
MFFFASFCLIKKKQKIKSAEIPPRGRVCIACRLCHPRAFAVS